MEELMYALREDWGPQGATDFLETITDLGPQEMLETVDAACHR